MSLLLALVSLVAASVTGALGYGYSSITVPLAILVVTSRVLNPALVVIELAVNSYSAVLNRRAIRVVWRRVAFVGLGIAPGVVLGAWCLSGLDAARLKVAVYLTLLPLILLQASGIRVPIRRERAAALPFGLGIGTLYSLTTISGPPLALFFNNQGLTKNEFRGAVAVTRVIESVLTLIVYAALGLLSTESAKLVLWLAPGVLIGIPLGHLMMRRIAQETFRRLCMSFDAWLVAFGLSRLIPTAPGYALFVATAIVDAILLRRFFAKPDVRVLVRST